MLEDEDEPCAELAEFDAEAVRDGSDSSDFDFDHLWAEHCREEEGADVVSDSGASAASGRSRRFRGKAGGKHEGESHEWGRFLFTDIYRFNERSATWTRANAWQATCGCHWNALDDRTNKESSCRKTVSWGARPNFWTKEEALCLLKEWCLQGQSIDGSSPTARKDHLELELEQLPLFSAAELHMRLP